MTGVRSSKTNDRISAAPSFFSSKKWIKLIPKTIGNRKRDCAWGCARGIDTTWDNLQIEKHKSGRRSFRSPNWFVLFDLQIFSGGVYPPSATSRTISFSISNSFVNKSLAQQRSHLKVRSHFLSGSDSCDCPCASKSIRSEVYDRDGERTSISFRYRQIDEHVSRSYFALANSSIDMSTLKSLVCQTEVEKTWESCFQKSMFVVFCLVRLWASFTSFFALSVMFDAFCCVLVTLYVMITVCFILCLFVCLLFACFSFLENLNRAF